MSKNGWIGVDLDGTLAEYHGWKGAYHIGEPIPKMVARIKKWLKEGKKVKIFTARAFARDSKQNEVIEKWCLEHIGEVLEITCVKDYSMIELWDDRAKQVVPNTGEAIEDLLDA
jgi:phosphoglycolate phosphatase-like HAD superfamily hydrolase